MVGTEFIQGQGLGNQLFCYITARCVASEHGYEFGCANQEGFANNIHSNRGMYFLDMDLGRNITPEEKEGLSVYQEKEKRLYLGNSPHDMTQGVYVAGVDDDLMNVPDNTLIMGNMQDPSYFWKYREQIKSWLKVKPEYESTEYSRENLCIINLRGGEYKGSPELYLEKKYWIKAMKYMRSLRSDMEFMIITDDVEGANKILPGIEAHHFDMGKDYVTLKNAHYLILSNSTFAFFPVLTSDTVKAVVAPKYWARHNVSNGYWASEQNIYDNLTYMDRQGRTFSASECRQELAEYKAKNKTYSNAVAPATGLKQKLQVLNCKYIWYAYYGRRAWRSLLRRIGKGVSH